MSEPPHLNRSITILRHKMFRSACAIASISLLSGCGLGHRLGMGGPSAASLGEGAATPSVFGYAVADEPQAALVARQILNDGGNAADAAAAAGFALSVTLPSRAGLGGGGACIIKMPGADGKAAAPVTLIFPAGASTGGGARPAAIPSLARGLLALQARYGTLPYASVIVPAERLAGGVPVSQALANDLAVVGPALLADPAAASVFSQNGAPLQAGDDLVQPDLAATFEVLRTQSVLGFYTGGFANDLSTAAIQAGGGLTVADLARAHPYFATPDITTTGGISVASLPVPPLSSATLPASAGFAALDKNGGVVACAVTMNNLFGTGRIAPGTGILLAASPKATPTPELAAAIAYTADGLTFRAAATGTGQTGAAAAAADAIADALANRPAALVPSPGRANVISCPGGVPGGDATCTATADPRGHGLATGGR
ncbi:MAG: gamma-glutamyltransferase [Acidocella sp.]|nr:gamma-glutamyltransferase [Acidocella sp.]